MELLGRDINVLAVTAWLVVLYIIWIFSEIIVRAFDPQLRKVPGPFISRFTTIPLKLAILAGNRSIYIHGLHEKYGSFVRISPYEVAVADIDAWRMIHRVGSSFNKGPFYHAQVPTQATDDTAGVFGVISNKTASHRRRLFQSVGTKKVVAEWEPQVDELASLAVAKIKQELKQEGKSDVFKWWTFLSSDVLGILAFGEAFNNVKNGQRNQLIRDVDAIMPWLGLRKTLPWLSVPMDYIPPVLLGKLAPPWDRFTMYGRKAVENTRAAISGGGTTLFSKMVNEDAKDQKIPDSLIEQEAANIIIAGTDTTAMTLAYFVYELLTHPTVKQKLYDELKNHDKHSRWSDLEEIPYLNHVIMETLRLHPAVAGSLERVVPLGGENLGRFVIPAGTVVSTQAWTFHHDPTVFKHPSTFNPDRWAKTTPAMKEYFMTFGGPSRLCLGQNVAWMNLLLTVSKFVLECPNVKLAPTATAESMEMADYFTVKPKGGKCEIMPA